MFGSMPQVKYLLNDEGKKQNKTMYLFLHTTVFSQSITESKLVLPVIPQAKISRDKMLGQGITTLIRKPKKQRGQWPNESYQQVWILVYFIIQRWGSEEVK